MSTEDRGIPQGAASPSPLQYLRTLRKKICVGITGTVSIDFFNSKTNVPGNAQVPVLTYDEIGYRYEVHYTQTDLSILLSFLLLPGTNLA